MSEVIIPKGLEADIEVLPTEELNKILNEYSRTLKYYEYSGENRDRLQYKFRDFASTQTESMDDNYKDWRNADRDTVDTSDLLTGISLLDSTDPSLNLTQTDDKSSFLRIRSGLKQEDTISDINTQKCATVPIDSPISSLDSTDNNTISNSPNTISNNSSFSVQYFIEKPMKLSDVASMLKSKVLLKLKSLYSLAKHAITHGTEEIATFKSSDFELRKEYSKEENKKHRNIKYECVQSNLSGSHIKSSDTSDLTLISSLSETESTDTSLQTIIENTKNTVSEKREDYRFEGRRKNNNLNETLHLKSNEFYNKTENKLKKSLALVSSNIGGILKKRNIHNIQNKDSGKKRHLSSNSNKSKHDSKLFQSDNVGTKSRKQLAQANKSNSPNIRPVQVINKDQVDAAKELKDVKRTNDEIKVKNQKITPLPQQPKPSSPEQILYQSIPTSVDRRLNQGQMKQANAPMSENVFQNAVYTGTTNQFTDSINSSERLMEARRVVAHELHELHKKRRKYCGTCGVSNCQQRHKSKSESQTIHYLAHPNDDLILQGEFSYGSHRTFNEIPRKDRYMYSKNLGIGNLETHFKEKNAERVNPYQHYFQKDASGTSFYASYRRKNK